MKKYGLDVYKRQGYCFLATLLTASTKNERNSSYRNKEASITINSCNLLQYSKEAS